MRLSSVTTSTSPERTYSMRLIPAGPIHAGAGDLVKKYLLAPCLLQGIQLRIQTFWPTLLTRA